VTCADRVSHFFTEWMAVLQCITQVPCSGIAFL